MNDEASKVVDVEDMQLNLTDLLSLVASGTELIVVDGETPLARIVPIKTADVPRIPGLHTGVAVMSDDFDDPLPDDFWDGEA